MLKSVSVYFCRLLLGILFFVGCPQIGNATHLRAADLTIEPICGSARTFRITVTAFLNTLSNTRFGTNSTVDFGDGSSVRIPLTIATLRPDLGVNIAVATFTAVHTYGANGTYTVAYIEHDRSTGILNIANSEDVAYTTFVNHVVNDVFACNNYPTLTVPPLDRACFGVAFFHTPGAYDKDGDSLSYELTIPKGSVTENARYTDPSDSKFYSNFNTGNEAQNGPPVFKIDPISGLLTWDSPGTQGEYNIAFNIIEWRKDSLTNSFTKLSTTTRDMQILVEMCDNTRPELQAPINLCVVAGTSINELITGTDADGDPVKIEVFSEIVDFDDSQIPATYSPSPQFMPSVPPAELRFQWTTDCIHVREQPYQVVFKITDNPPDGPKLVNFKVWTIKVIGPEPVWQEAKLDLVNRHAVLRWDAYSCANADKIQIWRKVDGFSYTPSLCETGLPRNLGYSLVGEVPVTQTNFIDTNEGIGLIVGARYCYRLLAYYGTPNKAYSRVSTEQCMGPIETDEPVITHVSVEKTSATDGAIRVSWRTPFAINKTQFPPPYEYDIQQAYGFIGEASLQSIGRSNDTTFLAGGLNALDSTHHFRVIIYGVPQDATVKVPIDTSAIASSVFLTLTPGEKKFDLTWADSVPWSNVVQTRPYHLIYRGIETDNPADMVLIDSVLVIENGFVYTDTGAFGNEGIQDDLRYSYRVETIGTYGNPKIELQKNFSQVRMAYPKSDLLPCTQVVTVSKIDCDDYWAAGNCDQREFTNRFSWHVTTQRGCRKDIAAYNVYAANSPDGEFTKIASAITDTSFQESGLPSFARCYKVSSIDKNGIESGLSDATCNDNCPYYLLPNVFTPNEDGFNDTFSANFDRLKSGEIAPGTLIRCPRFVQRVDLHIYNRWGQPVYQFKGEDQDSAVINWDGKDNHGNDLTTGVYYFTARVYFNVLDDSKKEQEIHGWVHLLR